MIKMEKLENARKNINEIDKKMAELFCRRMEAVKEVAAAKRELGLPVLSEQREAEVLERNKKLIENEEFASYYVNFLKGTMDLSKRYQHRLLYGMRVAYSGVPGAFANIAAKRIFPDADHVAYEGFEAAYDSVVNGECDCAVLPIENSYAGDVTQVMDMTFFGSLYINGVYDLEIMQNLLGLKGASVKNVKTVISHPQALAQSADYINAHGFQKQESINTAVAANMVAEGGDPTVAAIASEETAQLYGLEVLERAINQSSKNTTRFAVFSRVKNQDPHHKHFIMYFTVKNEAGSLSKAISILGQHGINLRALKSRPTKHLNWEYYFYVEGEGNIDGEEGKNIFEALAEECSNLKIGGNFGKEISLR